MHYPYPQILMSHLHGMQARHPFVRNTCGQIRYHMADLWTTLVYIEPLWDSFAINYAARYLRRVSRPYRNLCLSKIPSSGMWLYSNSSLNIGLHNWSCRGPLDYAKNQTSYNSISFVCNPILLENPQIQTMVVAQNINKHIEYLWCYQSKWVWTVYASF